MVAAAGALVIVAAAAFGIISITSRKSDGATVSGRATSGYMPGYAPRTPGYAPGYIPGYRPIK